MLRVHFTAEDLVRISLNPLLPPEAEAVLSLQMLRQRGQDPRFGTWRRGLHGRLPAAVRPLLDLVPTSGWVPEFLTPHKVGTQFVDAIRATPRRQLTAELNRLAAGRRLPAWVNTLSYGDQETLQAVAQALVAYRDIAIAPHTARMQSVLDADLARRTVTAARHGTETLLAGLHPAVRWNPPVLQLPSAIDQDIHLDGRGLRLVPLLFCGPLPRLCLAGPDDQPLLAVQLPIDTAPANPLLDAPSRRGQDAARPLGKLLGATRSAILHAVAAAPGLSTAELASRTAVSQASASEHATVLREAGLIISRRDRNRMCHLPTATAIALLRAPTGE